MFEINFLSLQLLKYVIEYFKNDLSYEKLTHTLYEEFDRDIVKNIFSYMQLYKIYDDIQYYRTNTISKCGKLIIKNVINYKDTFKAICLNCCSLNIGCIEHKTRYRLESVNMFINMYIQLFV